MRSKAVIAVLSTALLVGGGAIAAGAVSRHGASRQEVVAERGARVMPFSLESTTHVFDATDEGGIQRVVAKDRDDAREIELIRGHLRDEAEAFGRGDFGDPTSIHGEEMPGVDRLSAGYRDIDVRYRDLLDGAEIAYGTDDPEIVDALRAWFDAQLGDHGGDATTSERSGGDHAGHTDHEQ